MYGDGIGLSGGNAALVPYSRSNADDNSHKAYVREEPDTLSPATKAEVKARLHIPASVTDFDDTLDALLEAATTIVQDWINRKLKTHGLDLWLDEPPNRDRVFLPYPPSTAVVTVTTYDPDNTPTEFANTNYIVSIQNDRPKIVLRAGCSWPTDVRAADAFKFVFSTGYGADNGDVPQALREAVRRIAADMYLSPTDWCGKDSTEIIFDRLPTVGLILNQYATEKL